MANEMKDPESEMYVIVLRQCSPLVGSGAFQCTGKIEASKQRLQNHREGTEDGDPAKRQTRAWMGTPLAIFERKGEESSQFEMCFLRKNEPYSQVVP